MSHSSISSILGAILAGSRRARACGRLECTEGPGGDGGWSSRDVEIRDKKVCACVAARILSRSWLCCYITPAKHLTYLYPSCQTNAPPRAAATPSYVFSSLPNRRPLTTQCSPPVAAGLGNIRQASLSRDARPDSGPDDFSTTRGREPHPAHAPAAVFSTGRGGAGNYARPRPDPHPPRAPTQLSRRSSASNRRARGAPVLLWPRRDREHHPVALALAPSARGALDRPRWGGEHTPWRWASL